MSSFLSLVKISSRIIIMQAIITISPLIMSTPSPWWEVTNITVQIIIVSIVLVIKRNDPHYNKNYETYYRSARVQVWTISKYLLTNNFFSLSHSILLDLGLSWSILDYLGLSRCIWVHLGASPSISVNLGLYRSISDYLRLTLSISDYHRLS